MKIKKQKLVIGTREVARRRLHRNANVQAMHMRSISYVTDSGTELDFWSHGIGIYRNGRREDMVAVTVGEVLDQSMMQRASLLRMWHMYIHINNADMHRPGERSLV